MKQEMVIVHTAEDNQSKFVLKVNNKAAQRSRKIFENDGSRRKKTKRNNSISSPSRHVKMRFLLLAVSFLGVVNDLKPQNFNSLFTEYCKKNMAT